MLVMRWPRVVSEMSRHGRSNQLTYLLAEVSDWLIILVENNADLIHQSNLFLIVTV